MSDLPRTTAGRLMLTALRRAQPDWTGAVDYILAIEAESGSVGLDVAWAEAEKALPEGWFIESVRRDWHHEPPRWWVRRFRPIPNRNTETKDGPDGDTPAAALRALAARLSSATPEDET